MTIRVPKRSPIYSACLILLAFGLMHIDLNSKMRVFKVSSNVAIEENAARETIVANLSDQEIFYPHAIFFIDGEIYMSREDPNEILKLSTSGKILKRFGRRGEGPGEFLSPQEIRKFKGNIALLDAMSRRLVIYTKDGQYVDEFRIKNKQFGFIVNQKNHPIIYGRSRVNFYFYEYSDKGDFLGKFGKTDIDNLKSFNFDAVRHACFVPGGNVIWASYRNRYSLRCYKNKRPVIEIRARDDFFASEEQVMMGKKIRFPRDRSLHVAYAKDRLYSFFRKKDERASYCDIFELKNYSLIKRVKLKYYYLRITHAGDNQFYALTYDTNEDRDILFINIQLKNNKNTRVHYEKDKNISMAKTEPIL